MKSLKYTIKIIFKLIFAAVIILMLAAFFYPFTVGEWPSTGRDKKVLGDKIVAVSRQAGYPLIANYFLSSDQNFSYLQLARYDLVILPIDTQIYNKEFFGYARQVNPDIIILAYTPAQSVNINTLNNPASFNYLLNAQINDSWWLKDSRGQIISTWPGIKNINVFSNWAEWFPEFVNSQILSTNLWDGIFYDMVDNDISWTNNGDVDLNHDGQPDSKTNLNNQWHAGMERLLKKSQNLFGHKKIFINGSADWDLQKYTAGLMLEDFPTPWQGSGRWANIMNVIQQLTVNEKTAIINNLGAESDLKKMRFGLTSALLENIYFGRDTSINNHENLWWFDEYNVNLGAPVGQAINLLTTKNPPYQAGVWRRDFINGVVLVNSTSQPQTINLTAGIYEKIKGIQDPIFNNGEIINKITLNAADGIILFRKLETLTQANFTNGAFVRIFNANGTAKRAGFFAYEPLALGGQEIIIIDIDNDGQTEKIFAGKGVVKIIKTTGLISAEFYPYSQNYHGAINLALGDFNHDKKLEIVTGAGLGGGPQVRIFNYQGQLVNSGWFAFDQKNRGGVSVAIGDVNNDGQLEIITGAGRGLKPEIKIFNFKGESIANSFLAYAKTFTGGVWVATGDLNHDSKDEIITGAGVGGGPHVRIFDEHGQSWGKGFFAFEANKRQGVKVSTADIDQDGQIEILGMN